MKNEVFFVAKDGSVYTYERLFKNLEDCTSISHYCYIPDTYDILVHILLCILHGIDLVLLDHDFSKNELEALGIEPDVLKESIEVSSLSIVSKAELISAINGQESWKLTLFTSGTTGLPKKVTHRLTNLMRLVRQSEKQQQSVWGFAYNPTHIAGIQVFFQAIMNGNPMIDLFGLSKDTILGQIEGYSITNISATPTFYRMLMPTGRTFPSVRRITSGGERFDSSLAQNILQVFPNAQMRNIYASTEAGSVLESKNDRFTISDPTKSKIEGNRLFIHSSLLGVDDFSEEWYDTGDLVEMVDNASGEFIFLSRANEMINVGGYKANPLEIEEILCTHPAVIKARVWGKPNPVIGNILMADLVCNRDCSEKEIRGFLKGKLQDFKIPRVINFQDDINTTRSGKIKRV